jgi:FtsH-binding integral membrane protein
MIKCFKCQVEISEEARLCPQCGQNQFNTSGIEAFIGFFVMYFGFGFMLYYGFNIASGFGISLLVSLALSIYGYKKRRVE